MMAKTDSRGGIWDTVKTIFWALLIAAVFRSVLFQPFSIPSGSMKPTLLIGDYLFVSKYSYGFSRYSFPFAPNLFSGRIWSAIPERGDVIVFKHPQHDACSQGPIGATVGFVKALFGGGGGASGDCIDYVKRLIGLPGDQLQVKAGVLYINGERLKTEPTAPFVERKVLRGSPPRPPQCINQPVPLGGKCLKEMFMETLPNGRVHPVLNIVGVVGEANAAGFGRADNTAIYTVPEGHFFFMGDNRDNSVDSRFPSVGYVPFENLIGRAEVIAISSDGAFWEIWNWRFDRLFKSIE